MSAQPTGVSVTMRYIWFQFLFIIFPTMITINGLEHRCRWGETFFPLAPGAYTVEVAFKYFWAVPLGRATSTIQVNPGQVVRLDYRTPWLVYFRGKMHEVTAAAAA